MNSPEQKKSTPFYAAVAIINYDGQILLGKRKEDGIWTTPGGGGNEGETPEKAAAREAFEESGIPIDVRFLQPLKPIETRNGKLCHCFLYVCPSNQLVTSKLDPDEEVGKWKWYGMDQIPNAAKEDPRRFETIRNAYMKYHGITKSLIEKLTKGGKPAQYGEHRTYNGIEYQKMGDGTWKPVPKPVDADGKEKVQMMHPAKNHLNDMQSKVILEGQTLRTGEPVFTSVDAALAHGYDSKMFREAGGIFLDRSDKMSENIERLEKLKQPVDPSMKKIAHENMKIARAFTAQANHIDERQKKTQGVTRAKIVKKSVVMMGQQDAAEVDTGKFAQENKISMESDLYEIIHNIMDGYQPGDAPRLVPIDSGELHLVKVDDGMYSGVIKKHIEAQEYDGSPGMMMENAKVRIERMTIPSLVQFLIAKEYIKPPSNEPQIQSLVAKLESPINPLNEPIQLEVPVPSQDRTIRILELIGKLVG